MDIFERDFEKLYYVEHFGGHCFYNSGENTYSLQDYLKWKCELPFGFLAIGANFTINQIVPSLIALAKKFGRVARGFPPSSYTKNVTFTGNIIDYAVISRDAIESENPHIFLSKNCPVGTYIIIPVQLDNGIIMPEMNGVMLENKTKDGKLYGMFIEGVPIIVRPYENRKKTKS